MILTADDVAAALARPVEHRDGQWFCQVCSKAFTSKQGVGPHQLKHRRDVGLAPPRSVQIALPTRAGGMVMCIRPDCGARLKRQNYPRHLREVHGLDQDEALRTIQEHAEAAEAASRAVNGAVVLADEGAAEPERESLMTDLTAAEATAGVLSAARRDGLIPVGMLPAILAWVGHTERILDELTRRTDG